MSPAVEAFIGLGSNLERPVEQVRAALLELARLPRSRLLRRSPLYRSAPQGGPAQPDFVNAVALLETGLDPLPLLDALQAIEQRHGRVRAERWGPRTLDLDLLLYGDRTIDDERLRVPHARLHERAFVLVPLHDIAPDLVLPGLGPVDLCLSRLGDTPLQAIDEGPGRAGI